MGRLFLHLRSLNLVMKIGRANCEHFSGNGCCNWSREWVGIDGGGARAVLNHQSAEGRIQVILCPFRLRLGLLGVVLHWCNCWTCPVHLRAANIGAPRCDKTASQVAIGRTSCDAMVIQRRRCGYSAPHLEIPGWMVIGEMTVVLLAKSHVAIR